MKLNRCARAERAFPLWEKGKMGGERNRSLSFLIPHPALSRRERECMGQQ
jgi:hypothetical protein